LPDSSVGLKAILRLTEAQIERLQRVQAHTHPWQPEEDAARSLALAILTQDQRNKLAAAASILQFQNGAMQLVSVGAIGRGQWPGTCACFYPIRRDYTNFGLTDAQLARFEQLRIAYHRPAKSEDLAASYALVLDVLNEQQRIKLIAFEANLRLVNEAIDIGLLNRPPKGDPSATDFPAQRIRTIRTTPTASTAARPSAPPPAESHGSSQNPDAAD
jgi:hypothetical protein